MSWAIRLGPETNALWLTLVDEAQVKFSCEPRHFRSKSFAERTLKKAKAITAGELVLVQTDG